MRRVGHFKVIFKNEQTIVFSDGRQWFLAGGTDAIPDHEMIPVSDRLEDSYDLNDFAADVHMNAKQKGWHDEVRSALEIHALIHSEISEATEEVRAGKPERYIENGKPEGEAVELVDAVIRIADYFQAKGWDLKAVVREKMAFNATRPYRHGGKKY